MKLNLLFMAMDMLTLLAYPILLICAKLRQLSNSRQEIAVANLLAASPVTAGR